MTSLGGRRVVTIVSACALAIALASCTGAGTVPGPHGGGGPTPPPVPTLDNWIMYGHDGRHTSTSAANIPGSLKQAWTYTPVPLAGNTFNGILNAIATTTGVYVHYAQSGPTVFAGGPSVDGLTTGGSRMWAYVEHRDADFDHWLAAFNGGVVLQDDGEPLINTASGALTKWLASSFDVWGETIPDSTGMYGVNTFLADGPDLFVYLINTSNAVAWKSLVQKSTKYSNDNAGGLLLSNGVLFYAASYSDPSPNPSGLYALTASSGAKVAYVATTPTSEMSADANNIYLEEGTSTIIARSQSGLGKVWSANLAGGMIGAPVIANGMLIVATYAGIEAHDPATGNKIWSSSVQPSFGGASSTAICAAAVSKTLVVTAFDGLHVLSMTNGADLWHGGVAGATNPIIVNDPARGATVYVTTTNALYAYTP